MHKEGSTMARSRKGQTVDVKQADGSWYPATVVRVGRHKAQVSYPPRGKVVWVRLESIRAIE